MYRLEEVYVIHSRNHFQNFNVHVHTGSFEDTWPNFRRKLYERGSEKRFRLCQMKTFARFVVRTKFVRSDHSRSTGLLNFSTMLH